MLSQPGKVDLEPDSRHRSADEKIRGLDEYFGPAGDECAGGIRKIPGKRNCQPGGKKSCDVPGKRRGLHSGTRVISRIIGPQADEPRQQCNHWGQEDNT